VSPKRSWVAVDKSSPSASSQSRIIRLPPQQAELDAQAGVTRDQRQRHIDIAARKDVRYRSFLKP
jgi:hypothetical protein